MSGPLIIYKYNELGEPIYFIKFYNKSRTCYRTSFLNNHFKHYFALLDTFQLMCVARNLEITDIAISEITNICFNLIDSRVSYGDLEKLPQLFINEDKTVKLSLFFKYASTIKISEIMTSDEHNWRKRRSQVLDFAFPMLSVYIKDYGIQKFERIFNIKVKSIEITEFIDHCDSESVDLVIDNLTLIDNYYSIQKEFYNVYFACDREMKIISQSIEYL